MSYTLCFTVIYCLVRLRPHLFDLIKQRSKVTARNMQLNLFRMSKLIIGQEGEVLTNNFWPILSLLIFLSGCYLSKLMIVNNCLFFQGARNGMFSLWVKITRNLLLSIQLEILLFTNSLLVCFLFLIILRGGFLMGGWSNIMASSQYVPNIVHSHR